MSERAVVSLVQFLIATVMDCDEWQLASGLAIVPSTILKASRSRVHCQSSEVVKTCAGLKDLRETKSAAFVATPAGISADRIPIEILFARSAFLIDAIIRSPWTIDSVDLSQPRSDYSTVNTGSLDSAARCDLKSGRQHS
jgi:hypothetical protein